MGVTRAQRDEYLATLYPNGREKRQSASLLRLYESKPGLKTNNKAWTGYQTARFPTDSDAELTAQAAEGRSLYETFFHQKKAKP